MARALALRLEGGDELAKKLRALPRAVSGRVLEAAVLKGAEPIRDEARRLAPRSPGGGNLAQNIDAEVTEGGTRVVTVSVGPNKEAWYGIFPELGTKHHAAKPYLRPSFDSQKGEAQAAVGRELWDAILKVSL